ncbi:MAG: hypothetical protein RIQ60_3384 [Pseudomonadota bacterium]|jgi:MYXO-CTERM domain-containing protein
MRFVQISALALAVATLFAGPALAQSALTAPTVTLTQDTFNTVQPAVVMPDGGMVAKSIADSSTASFASFQSSLGVLTGVQASLQVVNPPYDAKNPNPGSRFLLANNQENSDVTTRLTTTWQLGSAANSFNGTLMTFSTAKDSTQSSGNAWQSLTFAPSGLAAFVDQGAVTSKLNTTLTLDAPIKGKNSDGSIDYSKKFTQTSLTNAPSLSQDTIVTSLPVKLSIGYSYLLHSNASFAQALDQDTLNLNFAQAGSQALSIHALAGKVSGVSAAGNTTLLDMTGVSCSGACANYQLNFTSFGDLVAGGAQGGNIAYLGGGGNATYTFSFSDNTAVGVSNTASTHQQLVVNVTAVPEPHGAAMLLAGLGAIAWLGRRRRVADPEPAPQLAKL